jgi:hypothetical protein
LQNKAKKKHKTTKILKYIFNKEKRKKLRVEENKCGGVKLNKSKLGP